MTRKHLVRNWSGIRCGIILMSLMSITCRSHLWNSEFWWVFAVVWSLEWLWKQDPSHIDLLSLKSDNGRGRCHLAETVWTNCCGIQSYYLGNVNALATDTGLFRWTKSYIDGSWCIVMLREVLFKKPECWGETGKSWEDLGTNRIPWWCDPSALHDCNIL